MHEAGTNMLLINKGQAKREPFKGIGGVQPKKIDFVHFDICCSPIFLLSIMGSYVFHILLLLFYMHLCEGGITKYRENSPLQKKWSILA